MRLAEKADAEEIADGMTIPEELSRRQDRLAAIASAKEKIEQRAAERYAREKQEYDEKAATREAKAKQSGKKPHGREPKPPEPGPRKKVYFRQACVAPKKKQALPWDRGERRSRFWGCRVKHPTSL